MGRPKLHDSQTGEQLLDAAERIVVRDGADALSIRTVAAECGVSSRAVYSVYGSKQALLAALGNRTFIMLGERVAAHPRTADPAADTVSAALECFRALMISRPALYEIGFQSTGEDDAVRNAYMPAAAESFMELVGLFARLADAAGLPGHEPREAAIQFSALCEGLATLELRERRHCSPVDEREWRERWRQATKALVAGFGIPQNGS